ncbi:LysR family transcriptional regulator [Chelativorans salis]|uniref:LysR family transcriptional regulator n=1 Tax=Chelativorans salis TaxID=2978478 RepID=A0ABT2LU33_9HYPH|nr:LysR family transcriptional regulator [Chelativorans sp. EGI FJ00035]MCT7376699.1 LysR family transcriptional regulator [Chelativorans sp. EGI FJ00035]
MAVAELGSFSRAAQRLNLTQTALSHRIRKIEADLGTRLLVRTSRDVSLTIAGQDLLPQVREQMDALAELYGAVHDSGRESRRRLVFACLPTVSIFHLPELIRDFSNANQGLEVVLLDQPAGRIVKLVQEGQAEFGITITGANPWDLEIEHLCTEPYVLLVSKHHRLAGRKSVARSDLLGGRLVRIRTQSINRQIIEDSLGSLSKQLDWRFEVQNVTTAMSLVDHGASVTVLPQLTKRLVPNEFVGLPFSDVDLSRNIVALQRSMIFIHHYFAGDAAH